MTRNSGKQIELFFLCSNYSMMIRHCEIQFRPEISETGKRVKSFPKHAFMWQIWGLSFNKTGNGFLGGGGGGGRINGGGSKKLILNSSFSFSLATSTLSLVSIYDFVRG